MKRSLYLPRRDVMAKTNADDPVDYYYHLLTGPVYRKRLTLTLAALGPGPFDSLLEVGYGSGILLPELSRRCELLYGVDLHHHTSRVQRLLATEHVSAELKEGSVLALDYAPKFFDAVVCLSVLEHMGQEALPLSVREIHRVSKAGATVVLGFPARNIITDLFYKWLGFRPRDLHPSGHRDILEAARACFTTVEARWWPGFLPLDLALYVVCRCRA